MDVQSSPPVASPVAIHEKLSPSLQIASPQRKTKGKFIFDETSELWYNPGTKLYFNETTKLYSKHPDGPLFYVYDQKQKKLTVVNTDKVQS